MNKIKLSKSEKKVFLKAMAGKELPPAGMHHDIYLAAVVTLHQKGLVDAKFNYDEVLSISPTLYGQAYFAVNPHLYNPVDWQLITAISTAVTALAALAALFVACTK